MPDTFLLESALTNEQIDALCYNSAAIATLADIVASRKSKSPEPAFISYQTTFQSVRLRRCRVSTRYDQLALADRD